MLKPFAYEEVLGMAISGELVVCFPGIQEDGSRSVGVFTAYPETIAPHVAAAAIDIDPDVRIVANTVIAVSMYTDAHQGGFVPVPA